MSQTKGNTYRVGGSILGLVGVDGLKVTRVRDDNGVLLKGVEGRHDWRRDMRICSGTGKDSKERWGSG